MINVGKKRNNHEDSNFAEGISEIGILPNTRYEIEFRGKKYSSKKELAEAFGIRPKNFRDRLREGWSTEEALGLSPRQSVHTIIISGRAFNSIREASAFYGLDEKLVAKRLRDGWSPEEAFELTRRKRPTSKKCKPVIFLGIEHPSREKVKSLYGKNIFRRLRRGWTEREAAGLDPKPPRNRAKNDKKRIGTWRDFEIIEGQHYPKIDYGGYKLYVIENSKNAKVYVGITISPLKDRFKGHLSEARTKKSDTKLSRAIRKYGEQNFQIKLVRCDAKDYRELQEQEISEIARRNSQKNGYNTASGGSLQNNRPITIKGVTFASQGAAAEAYNILPGTFNQRLNSGLTPEQAAGLEERTKYGHHTIEIGNETFSSLSEACERYSLDYKTTHARVRKGWTYEQALNLSAPPRPNQMIKPVITKEKEFSSRAEFARYLGLHYSTITNLLKTNSPDELMSLFGK